MEGESGVSRSTIDEIYSSIIEENQMKGESGVTPGIIFEFHSWDIQGDQKKGESMVLLEVSSMNFILRLSKKMK